MFEVKWNESCSIVSHFQIPWTIVCQVPLSMEFSRLEYGSGWLFPSQDLPNLGCKVPQHNWVLYHLSHQESITYYYISVCGMFCICWLCIYLVVHVDFVYMLINRYNINTLCKMHIMIQLIDSFINISLENNLFNDSWVAHRSVQWMTHKEPSQ